MEILIRDVGPQPEYEVVWSGAMRAPTTQPAGEDVPGEAIPRDHGPTLIDRVYACLTVARTRSEIAAVVGVPAWRLESTIDRLRKQRRIQGVWLPTPNRPNRFGPPERVAYQRVEG